MALPHQVRLAITYDGTAGNKSAGSGNNGGSGKAETTYTVVSGDTLWGIAKKFLGSGAKYTEIYNANAATIEETAKKHGKKSSQNGHWIWPGEVLTIPGNESANTSSSSTSVAAETIDLTLATKIVRQATAFSYTDVASGESDSVSITLHDIGKEWLGELMPKRGANLAAGLQLVNWNEGEETKDFICGNFILDDISFSGRPLSCVLGGVSVPAMDDFKSSQKTKTWEKTTIQNIASEIAKAAGVDLVYDAEKIQIAELEQSKQTNSAFLYNLCEKYGLAMKVYNHKIVIFDILKYEAKKAVTTLSENDLISWSYNTTIDGTYTGVELRYTDPDSKKKEAINVVMGEKGRLYSMNTQASSKYDAELQAAAKVNAANRKIETMDITIRANVDIVASHCVNISGLGNADGKYYVDKIKHSVGNGYKMNLSMHKVQEPVLVNKAAEKPSGGNMYTVVSGDTLWGISKKFYGTGTKYGIIYSANSSVIEETAKKHGKKSSDNGHWIWPGEVLTIPGV